MDTDMTTDLIDNIIIQIQEAEEPESITNYMVAAVLEYLNNKAKEHSKATQSSKQDIEVLKNNVYTSLANIKTLQAGAEIQKNDITTVAASLETLRQTVNALLGHNATEAIESFNEIIDFLAGLKDDQQLAILLANINSRIQSVNTSLTDLVRRFGAAEDRHMEDVEDLTAKTNHALELSERLVYFDGVLDHLNDAEYNPPGIYFFQDKGRFGKSNGRDVDFGAFDGFEPYDEPDLHIYHDNTYRLYVYDGVKLLPYISAGDIATLPNGDRFTVKGYFLSKRGDVNKVSSPVTGITPLLPLSRTYPIVLQNVRAYNNAVAVCFYDAAGNFISYPEGIENLTGDFTVTPDKYPANACYFRACTEKAGSSYTHGPSVESHEGAICEAIQASKLALFIDEFNAAAGTNGKYEPVNAPDPRHPFYLNTLWLTYEEAVASMAHINEIYLRGGCSMKGLKIRTNMLSAIPLSTGWGTGFVDLNGVCLYNSIEVLNVGDIAVDKSSALSAFAYNCDNLHTIIGQISLLYVTRISTDAFRLSPKLQNVRLYNLKVSVSFKDCPLLSLDSMQYMVNNAANTEAITITLHPDAFARLTTELVEAATAKQITFATTT